jgi:hypothetical protein
MQHLLQRVMLFFEKTVCQFDGCTQLRLQHLAYNRRLKAGG